MSDQDRFDELWMSYLDGELDEAGVTQLRTLLAAEERFLNEAIERFRIHRLLGLSAPDPKTLHQAFARQDLSELPSQPDEFVAQVMNEISQRKSG